MLKSKPGLCTEALRPDICLLHGTVAMHYGALARTLPGSALAGLAVGLIQKMKSQVPNPKSHVECQAGAARWNLQSGKALMLCGDV